MTTYRRCKDCGEVEMHDEDGDRTRGGGHVAHLEPVAVLPLAEAEALRRLRDAAEDDELAEKLLNYKSSEWWAVDAYRAALRAAMGAKP